jgi:hypothetical protein
MDNGSFTFYVDVSFLYHCQDLYRTWLYIWVTQRVSYKKQVLLTFRKHRSFFYGIRVVHLFSFLCCPLIFLYVLSSVLQCLLRFPHNKDVRLYLQWFVRGLMSYLCVFVYSGVQHIQCIVLCFCFDFLRLLYPMLPVSLDCLFLIAPSVFSNVYLWVRLLWN